MVERAQVTDIVGRVIDLLGGKWSLPPVCTGVRLVEVDVQALFDQVAVTDLIAVAEHGGGELGIENALRQRLAQHVEQFQILAGGVEYEGQVRPVEQIKQRGQIVDGQGIDACDQRVIGDL